MPSTVFTIETVVGAGTPGGGVGAITATISVGGPATPLALVTVIGGAVAGPADPAGQEYEMMRMPSGKVTLDGSGVARLQPPAVAGAPPAAMNSVWPTPPVICSARVSPA